MEDKMERGLMLNGLSATDLLEELHRAFWVYHKDTNADGQAMPRHDPNIDRQRRISDNQKGLEDKVKEALGGSIKASKPKADAIVERLAYEIYSSEQPDAEKRVPLGKFDDEQVRKYLSEAAAATGNATIGNKLAFIESIMNMPAAKPGDPQYDPNSPLAVLIGYIAAQRDRESKRINYLTQLLAEYWQKPETGIELQEAVSHAFKLPLGRTATAQDALTEIRTRAAVESQKYAATGPKTYETVGGPSVQRQKAA